MLQGVWRVLLLKKVYVEPMERMAPPLQDVFPDVPRRKLENSFEFLREFSNRRPD
jgi:hypothetical protein